MHARSFFCVQLHYLSLDIICILFVYYAGIISCKKRIENNSAIIGHFNSYCII